MNMMQTVLAHAMKNNHAIMYQFLENKMTLKIKWIIYLTIIINTITKHKDEIIRKILLLKKLMQSTKYYYNQPKESSRYKY